MAYTVSKTSALQTAIKAAVDISIAELNAGLLSDHDALMARVGELRESFKAELFEEVDRDNAAMASAPKYSGSSSPRTPFTPDEAKQTVLNFGAFKGLTLEQVYKMTESEAANYSGGAYTKAGADWLRWAAQNKDPKGNFIKVRAQVVLDNPPA